MISPLTVDTGHFERNQVFLRSSKKSTPFKDLVSDLMLANFTTLWKKKQKGVSGEPIPHW
jgi:hypothetical protein